MCSFFSFLKIVSVDSLLEWLMHLTQGSTYQSRMLLTNQQINSDLSQYISFHAFKPVQYKSLDFLLLFKEKKPFYLIF